MELLTDRLHQVQDLKRRRQLKNHRLTIQVHIEVLSNWKFRTNIHQVQDLKKKKTGRFSTGLNGDWRDGRKNTPGQESEKHGNERNTEIMILKMASLKKNILQSTSLRIRQTIVNKRILMKNISSA